jgi:uncharacterized YigZ family protein
MTNSFKTIAVKTNGLYKEKGSKFLSFAFPITTVAQVDQYLKQTRKKFHDASHYCYAYILGPDGQEVRANDDGEPKHSAGDPILGQIKSLGLTNTLVIVVRYFGGTKLGVSGLIRAYKTAAAEVLATNNLIVKYVTQPLILSYPYVSTHVIMKLVDDFNINVEDQEFGEQCVLRGTVKIAELTPLQARVKLLQTTGTSLDIVLK